MIQGGADIHFLSVLWAILFLGLPTLVVPVAAGIACGYRAGWIWGVLGALIALVIGVGEITLYAAWLLGFRRHGIFDDPFTALEAFGALAALLVIQIIMALGVCGTPATVPRWRSVIGHPDHNGVGNALVSQQEVIMIQGWPEIEIWWIWWIFLSLTIPILLPPLVGAVAGWRTIWLTGMSGFGIGIAVGVLGLASYLAWYIWVRDQLPSDRHDMVEAFLGLGILVALQSLVVLAIIWCIERRRNRGWS